MFKDLNREGPHNSTTEQRVHLENSDIEAGQKSVLRTSGLSDIQRAEEDSSVYSLQKHNVAEIKNDHQS